jgi:hypothetical protein
LIFALLVLTILVFVLLYYFLLTIQQVCSHKQFSRKEKKDNKDNKGNKDNNECIYPSNYENVNYKLFTNKDGQYAWRLFQLIHPVLYVDLVHKITIIISVSNNMIIHIFV